MISKIHHVGIVVEKLDHAYAFWRDYAGASAACARPGSRTRAFARRCSPPATARWSCRAQPVGQRRGALSRQAGRGPPSPLLERPTWPPSSARFAAGTWRCSMRRRADGLGRPRRLSASQPPVTGCWWSSPPRRTRRPSPESPVRLKRLVIGCAEPQAAARTYQQLFGLPEVEINGGPAACSGGRAAAPCSWSPPPRWGGCRGWLRSPWSRRSSGRWWRGWKNRTKMLVGAAELTVEPESSHGVHLHISRYHFP